MTPHLYLLPFDHRHSFIHDLYNFTLPLSPEQTRQIIQAKQVIYQGFLLANLPPSDAGILVDEEFGTEILQDAQQRGFITACPIEKSGQDIFDLEYGADWLAHIKRVNPMYVKALVRYNPAGNEADNALQRQRLHRVSLALQGRYKFMFELLVPPLSAQLATVDNKKELYDTQQRPGLMVKAIQELQAAGITPDIWKVEGVDSVQDAAALAQAAQTAGAQLIVLGRDAQAQQVERWLSVAAQTPGFIGFAVGRTSFEEPLQRWKAGEWSREQAAQEISQRFVHWVKVFEEAGTR